jgi:hypothetical protein
MKDSQETIRRQALPWDGEPVVQFYLKTHPAFPYREQFRQLFREAYHTYLAACPRASIIVAGEALLRAIYDCTIQLLASGANVTIRRGRRQALPLDNATPIDVLYHLTDELTFFDAIQVLQKSKVYPNDLINLMFVVKDLRNRAAHGDLPVLDDWDPDDPRPSEQFIKMLSDDTFEFPEGYRFIPSTHGAEWFTFDLRKYKCGSFKPLAWEERFAAMQYLLVLEVITKLKDCMVKTT